MTYDLSPLNRKSVTDNGDKKDFVTSPNGLNQYTSVGGQGMSYDGNFNLTQFNFWGGWTYQYNAENQLISGTGGGNSFLLVYDGLGRCLKRTINGAVTVLAYDGWKPIEEWNGAGNVQAWNIYGPGADEILYRQTTMGAFRYHTDKEGNVTFLLDGNGNGLERYTYDAFGGTTVTDWDGTNARDWSRYGNRFRFNGREYFAEMGIYDYRNRWYHPYLGRFLQVDPLGLQTEGDKLSPEQTALYPKGQAPEKFASSEINLYRYCADDPVDRTDSLGLTFAEDLDGGFGDGLTGGNSQALYSKFGITKSPNKTSAAYQVGQLVGSLFGGIGAEARFVNTSKTAFEIAEEGGRHAGFLKNYLSKPISEINKAIKSIEGQIAEHEAKIANPEKFLPGFKQLDARQQKALISKIWPSDIQRQKQQIEILRTVKQNIK